MIDGQFDITLREPDGQERTAELRAGDIFVVPRGIEHKPSSPGGAILMFEPSGTLTTGDRHEGDIPAHVDSTTGRASADKYPRRTQVDDVGRFTGAVTGALSRAAEFRAAG